MDAKTRVAGQGRRRPGARRALVGLASLALLVPLLPGSGPGGEDRAAALGQPADFAGVYEMHLGGLKGGEMTLEARLDGARYAGTATARTAGIVAVFFDAGFVAETEGLIEDTRLVPERFSADSFSRGESRKVALRFEAGQPAAVDAVPPFTPKPWQVDPAEQTGTFDPISAALTGLALQREEALCGRSVEVFDGRRRYAIELDAAVPDSEDGLLRCAALYRRVAGFKPKMLEKPPFPFTVWFAKGENGLWHVTRAMGETPAGMASVTLRTE